MQSDLIHVRMRSRTACWTRAEYRTERISNVVGSHAAYEGILSQVMGHKPCRYIITRVALLFEPRWLPMTCNEIKNFGNGQQVNAEAQRTLRTTSLLAGGLRTVRDDDGERVQVAGVDYIVSFHLEFSEIKYLKMLFSRLRTGRYHGDQPFMGTRGSPCRVDHIDDLRTVTYPELRSGSHLVEHRNGLRTVDFNSSLGLSFYGTDWSDSKHPNYFAPLDVVKGIVKYPSWDEVRRLGIKRETAA